MSVDQSRARRLRSGSRDRGPPVETEEGRLVFTHGVGPTLTYAIGAIREEDLIRIIAARLANKREQGLYRSHMNRFK